MGAFNKLAGQTAIYGLGSVIPRILNYILLTPFYTRVLPSVSDYGTHSYLYSFCAFAIIVLTFGMETTFFRYAKSKGLSNVYSTSFFFLTFNALLFSFLVLLFDNDISNLLKISRVDYIWYFVGIIALDVISAIPFATLRFQEKAKTFALIKIGNVLINIAINLFYLLLLPYLSQHTTLDLSGIFDSNNLLEYTFRANLITNVITFLILVPLIKNNFCRPNLTLLREMLFYSFPIMLSGLLGMINEVSDKILLNYLLPAHVDAVREIGIYAANYKIAALVTIFNTMFRFALEPFFFKVADTSDKKTIYALITKYYLIFGLCIVLGVYFYIDLFKYFISSEYRSGLSVIPIILFANFFFGLYYTMSVWYKVTDKTYFSAIFALIGAVLTVVCNFLLVPSLGYYGSAISTFICYFAMLLLTYMFGQRHFRIKYDLKSMLFSLFVAIGLFIVSYILNIEHLISKLLVNSLFFVVFLGVVFVSNKELRLKSFRHA